MNMVWQTPINSQRCLISMINNKYELVRQLMIIATERTVSIHKFVQSLNLPT